MFSSFWTADRPDNLIDVMTPQYVARMLIIVRDQIRFYVSQKRLQVEDIHVRVVFVMLVRVPSVFMLVCVRGVFMLVRGGLVLVRMGVVFFSFVRICRMMCIRMVLCFGSFAPHSFKQTQQYLAVFFNTTDPHTPYIRLHNSVK